ncbi:MAG TPA: hypothetical protein DCG13_03180 [Legionellales bacterium]|nr:hypothetical protein [Legionellales bacterium]
MMIKKWLRLTAGLAGSLLVFTAHTTVEHSSTTPLKTLHSVHALQASWAFFGRVNNENGEKFQYFFQIQRQGQQLDGVAAIVDVQKRSLLLYEKGQGIIEGKTSSHWQAGHLFLQFNSITNSWVFGLNSAEKKGFNFKVDMLGSVDENYTKEQRLQKDLHVLLNQTGRLNGHLQFGASATDVFVTAKQSWFEQIWTNEPQSFNHPLTSVICEVNDESFYNISKPEKDSLQASISSWYDKNNELQVMSQFMSLKQKNAEKYTIELVSPKLTLNLQNMLPSMPKNQEIILGLLEKPLEGACVIAKNTLIKV